MKARQAYGLFIHETIQSRKINVFPCKTLRFESVAQSFFRKESVKSSFEIGNFNATKGITSDSLFLPLKSRIHKYPVSFLDKKRDYFNRKKDLSNKVYFDFLDNNKSQFILLAISTILLLFYLLSNTEDELKQDKNIERQLRFIFHAFQVGDINKFALQLFALAEENPKLSKAIKLLESEKFEEAMFLFDEIFVKDYKLRESYYVIKGILYSELHRYKDAINYFDEALKTKADYVKACAYYHKSITLRHLHEIDEANKCLDRAKSIHAEVTECDGSYITLRNLLTDYLSNLEHANIADLASTEKVNPPLYMNPQKRVTIRVWLPKIHRETGHASLETEENYMSFWPIEDELNLSENAGHLSYFEDIYIEGRLPDIRITLYSLDADAINKAYSEFRKSGRIWDLFASTYGFKNKGAQNCSGLTADLLKEGGIDKLAVLYAETFFEFAHNGLFGEMIANTFGEYKLRTVRNSFVLLSLYASGWFNAIPPCLIHVPLYAIGAGAIVGGFDAAKSSRDGNDTQTIVVNGIRGTVIGSALAGLISYILKYHIPVRSEYQNLDLCNITAAEQRQIFSNMSFSILCLLPVVIMFGDPNFLAPALASLTGGVIDTTDGTGLIITPKGIAKWAQYAREAEHKKYQLTSNDKYQDANDESIMTNRFFQFIPALTPKILSKKIVEQPSNHSFRLK